MICTSYFAKYQSLVNLGFKCISIAQFKPEWYHGMELPMLAPPKELLKLIKSDKIGWDEYSFHYDIHLCSQCTDIMNLMTTLINSNLNIAFLCYESPEKNCHRHLFAKWVNENFDKEIITEYNWT